MTESQQKPKRFSMLREFRLADLFTLANAAFGTISLFMCLAFLESQNSRFIWIAIACLPLSFIADGLDGWVARKRQAWSRIGADLDSLADVISFGVAPAVLAFTLGMRGGWDIVVLVYFVLCGISRLARYNVTAEELSGEDGKVKYFEGTPIPSSLILVVVLAIAVWQGSFGVDLWFGEIAFLGPKFHPLVLIFALSGSAMVSSSLRIPKP